MPGYLTLQEHGEIDYGKICINDLSDFNFVISPSDLPKKLIALLLLF
jgi:hypothetical protein